MKKVKITRAQWEAKHPDYKGYVNGTPYMTRMNPEDGITESVPVEIIDEPPKVHRYGDPTPGAWQTFITAMRSGSVFECDEEMYFYWLEVLPPAWMRRRVTIRSEPILTHFGFAEGAERVVAFLREGDRYFGCQTDILNPHA